MIYLKSWLEDYIDLSDISDKDIASRISTRIAELEEVTTVSDWFDGKVVLGKITKIEKHPDADKLQLCTVSLGGEDSVLIITAAPNPYEGMYVPVALDGAQLPHIRIESRPMRGIMSQGMCLGKSELLLEETESEGLWDVITEYGVTEDDLGKSLSEVFSQLFPAQTLYEIDILPDKFAYLSSHVSLALELGHIFGVDRLKGYAKAISEGVLAHDIIDYISGIPTNNVEFSDTSDYSKVFTSWSVRSDSEIATPCTWSQRLFLTQENLTFTPADISNYLLLDIGQPTHFFGQDVEPDGWSITPVEDSEAFEGLGQLKNTMLPAGTPVIKRDNVSLALPAISGGKDTGSQQGNTALTVECAVFESDKVVEHSFKLGYRSLASKYYAAGVQTSLIPFAIYCLRDLPWQWTSLVRYGVSDIADLLKSEDAITIEWDFLRDRLDGNISKEDIISVLSRFGSVDGDAFYPQLFYRVIHNREDMLHEVARSLGYQLSKDQLLVGLEFPETSEGETRQFLTETAVKHGFWEIITRPFIETELSNEEIIIDPYLHNLKLISTHRSDRPLIRTHLVAHHLQSVSKALLKGNNSPAVYELTRVYHKDERLSGDFEERIVAGGAYVGDGYMATTYLHDLARQLGQGLEFNSEDESVLGREFTYSLGQGITARVWEVKNSIKKTFDIALTKSVWCFEIVIPEGLLAVNSLPKLKLDSAYPEVERSYSLQTSLSWKDISQVIDDIETAFADISYSPVQHSPEYSAYTVSIVFRPYHNTLTKDQIQTWEQQLLESLQEKDSEAIWR